MKRKSYDRTELYLAIAAGILVLWLLLRCASSAVSAEPAIRETRQPCPCPANTDCQHGACPRSCPSGCLVTTGYIEQATRAVVRMRSHGISGQIIWTGPGKSYILSCAHGHEGRDRYKPMSVEVWWPTTADSKAVSIKLLAIDYRRDLALIELGDGPLPAVISVPLRGYQPTQRCLSVGYDRMQWPAVQAPATVLCQWTYTREHPVPGRSGGALIDERGYLIGVCEGYELTRGGRGMYVSLNDIQDFLAAQGWNLGGGGGRGNSPPRPTPLPPNCRH